MGNRLILELLADNNGLLRGLQTAQRQVDRFVDSSATAGKTLGGGVNQALSAFQSLATGGAAAAGVLAGGLAAAATAAVLMTTTAGKQVEALDHLSQKTGITIQSIQRMSVVMAENNFEAGTLTSGMRTLSKLITDARNPASDAATTFEEMGLSIHQLGSTEDVIRAVANKFAAMPDGVDKSRLAITLFGKAGLEMIPVLNRGAAALDASAEASKRFGVVLSTQQVTALEAADDASDRLGVALQGLQQQLSATFAPTVTSGINAVTEGVASLTRVTQNYGAALEQIKKEHPIISSFSPATAAAMAAARASQMPPPPVGVPGGGGPADAHVADFKAAMGASEEAKGLALRKQHIAAYQQQLALGHAEEALGRVLNEIEQRKVASVNAQLETLFQQESSYHVLTDEELKGWEIARSALETWRHRNDQLEMAVERSRTVDQAQQALFRSESGMMGASEAARRVRMQLIEDEGALQRQQIDETIFNEQHKNAAIENLDLQLQTRRLQAIQEFPSVWEQQLQTVVASNTFSVGQIVTGWTGGLANAIVNFENFGQAVTQIGKQTAATLLQGLLNYGVQAAAQWALQAAQETAIKTAEATAVVGINTAKNASIVAGDAAGATGTVSIWAGAGEAMVGLFGIVSGAIEGLIMGTILPALIEAGTAVITFLSGIASALDASIFGIPFSVPVWAAVALVGAAIGSIAAFAFADGGIATGPTMGLVGEAGSSEAIIPLNSRGAAFMREALGGGTGGVSRIEVPVYLDGRKVATGLAKHTGYAWRKMGAPA